LIKVVQYGFGEIGRQIAKLVLEKRNVQLIGCVDINPDLIGRDVGELSVGDSMGIPIVHEKDCRDLLLHADVTVLTTSSRLKSILPQLETVAEAGSDVISTCEELSYPFHENPDLSRSIDRLAEKAGITVLGTGVNPGFVMDALPIITSACCQQISGLSVHRIVNVSNRRLALQKKIGTGMDRAEFQRRANEGLIGHVGLKESTWMIMDALGWGSGTVQESISPMIADRPIRSQYFEVRPGQVCGLDQTVSGRLDGKEVLVMRLEMYLEADSADIVEVSGTPSIKLVFQCGLHGDAATTAIAYNMNPRVIEASPGLKTMLDMALPRAFV